MNIIPLSILIPFLFVLSVQVTQVSIIHWTASHINLILYVIDAVIFAVKIPT